MKPKCKVCGGWYYTNKYAKICGKKPPAAHLYKVGQQFQKISGNIILTIVTCFTGMYQHKPAYVVKDHIGRESEIFEQELIRKINFGELIEV